MPLFLGEKLVTEKLNVWLSDELDNGEKMFDFAVYPLDKTGYPDSGLTPVFSYTYRFKPVEGCRCNGRYVCQSAVSHLAEYESESE